MNEAQLGAGHTECTPATTTGQKSERGQNQGVGEAGLVVNSNAPLTGHHTLEGQTWEQYLSPHDILIGICYLAPIYLPQIDYDC